MLAHSHPTYGCCSFTPTESRTASVGLPECCCFAARYTFQIWAPLLFPGAPAPPAPSFWGFAGAPGFSRSAEIVRGSIDRSNSHPPGSSAPAAQSAGFALRCARSTTLLQLSMSCSHSKTSAHSFAWIAAAVSQAPNSSGFHLAARSHAADRLRVLWELVRDYSYGRGIGDRCGCLKNRLGCVEETCCCKHCHRLHPADSPGPKYRFIGWHWTVADAGAPENSVPSGWRQAYTSEKWW